MSVGILSRSIEFVMVMCVLDGPDAMPSLGQLTSEFAHERRLAVVFAADHVQSLHDVGFLVETISAMLLRLSTTTDGFVWLCLKTC
jgi:hypothetical protein